MRIERNLSQEGLASLLPGGHRFTWVSRIERGGQEPSLPDLRALAAALQVDVRWLITGDAGEDSEFLAQLRGIEPLLDDRGRAAVIATARYEVQEAVPESLEASLRRQHPELGPLLDELAQQEAARLRGQTAPAVVPAVAPRRGRAGRARSA